LCLLWSLIPTTQAQLTDLIITPYLLLDRQAAVSGIELQDKLASGLIVIVPRLLIQYKLESNLHPTHQGVLDCVKALFTQIIVFLVRVREYFCQLKPVRRCIAAFSSKFDDILKDVQTCVNDLDRVLNSTARQGTFIPAGYRYGHNPNALLQHKDTNLQSRTITVVVRNSPICFTASLTSTRILWPTSAD
jgi:hypothetical protein